MTSWRARIVAVLAAGAAVAALVALSPGSGTGSRTERQKNTVHHRNAATPPILGGSINQTDKTWICNGPVALDSVTVTMDAAAQALPRDQQDAIHLENGCTGTIGTITVVQYAADGIKVGNGPHDLTIGGGSIRCLAKASTLHQDGIQVMSGVDITFQNLSIDCGRPGDGVINSNMFFNKGVESTVPPTNVVCDGCKLGAGAAHTVSIQNSIASGVRDSILCPALYTGLTVSIGPAAVDPVNEGNQFPACPGGLASVTTPSTTTTTSTAPTTTPTVPTVQSRLTIAAATRIVTNGSSLLLTGALASGRPGRQIDVYERPFDASGETLVATTKTDASGQWQLTVRPKVSTTYSARARSFASIGLVVQVRPVVTLRAGTKRLTVKVAADRPLTGRSVFIQRFVNGRWRSVGTVVLGPHSGGVFVLKATTTGRLRASLPAAPGYLGATSEVVDI
jgi:hypothetical protein